MSFKWIAPKAKEKKAETPQAAPVVAAGGVEVAFPAIISQIRTTVDKGLKLTLELPDTDTLDPKLIALFFMLKDKQITVKLEN